MIFNISFEETKVPWGCMIRIAYLPLALEASWYNTAQDINDAPLFFGNAKKALTLMAKHLSVSQKKLEQADIKDCDKAMLNYVTKGYSQVGSFRDVHIATAELVHGVEVANRDIYNTKVPIPLENFDITIGSYAMFGGFKFKGIDDIAGNFQVYNPDSAEFTPGTRLVLKSLQDAALNIEEWYKNLSTFPPPPPAPRIPPLAGAFEPKAASKADPFGDLKILKQKILKAQNAEQSKTVESIIKDITYPDPSQMRARAYESDLSVKSYRTTREPSEFMPSYFVFCDSVTGQEFIAPIKRNSLEFSVDMDSIFNQNFHIEADVQASRSIPFVNYVMQGQLGTFDKNNPEQWAKIAHANISDIAKKLADHLDDDDETRVLLNAVKDLLSDHLNSIKLDKEDESK